MLWSQIKLSPYYFNDLQISGESDNRPGTGRFSSFFLALLQIVRARLYMVTLAVRRPAGVFRVRHFTQMKQFYTCNDVYVEIIIRHYASQKRLSNKKTKQDFDSGFVQNDCFFLLPLHSLNTGATAIARFRFFLINNSFSSAIEILYLYPR